MGPARLLLETTICRQIGANDDRGLGLTGSGRDRSKQTDFNQV